MPRAVLMVADGSELQGLRRLAELFDDLRVRVERVLRHDPLLEGSRARQGERLRGDARAIFEARVGVGALGELRCELFVGLLIEQDGGFVALREVAVEPRVAIGAKDEIVAILVGNLQRAELDLVLAQPNPKTTTTATTTTTITTPTTTTNTTTLAYTTTMTTTATTTVTIATTTAAAANAPNTT